MLSSLPPCISGQLLGFVLLQCTAPFLMFCWFLPSVFVVGENVEAVDCFSYLSSEKLNNRTSSNMKKSLLSYDGSCWNRRCLFSCSIDTCDGLENYKSVHLIREFIFGTLSNCTMSHQHSGCMEMMG